MTKEELKKFFERYDIFTLDSLNILINYLDEEEKKEIYPPFKNVYKNKYKEVEREFEGINEYDFICKLLNFDIEDIINGIDKLNKKELEFLNHITYTAKSKVSRTEKLNDKMHDDIVKFQEESDAYEKYSRHSNPLADDFTDKELEAYLKKYSIPDLEQFKKLLDLACYEWNVTRLYKIYKKESDSRSIYKEYNTIEKYQKKLSESKISDLMNNKLTKKELKLLHNLVDTASMVLDSEYEDDTRELDILEKKIVKKLS